MLAPVYGDNIVKKNVSSVQHFLAKNKIVYDKKSNYLSTSRIDETIVEVHRVVCNNHHMTIIYTTYQ